MLVIANELEATQWTNYHSFLVVYTSIITFFTLFSITFIALVTTNIEESFGWMGGEILIYFGIMGTGTLFAIVPRFLADRFGRKPFILLFNVVASLAIIAANFSYNTPVFVGLRIVAGIFGVNLSAVIISEEVPARHRGKAIGITTGIGMTSSLLGAYLLTLAGPKDMWRYLYSFVMLSGMIIISILWFKLRETPRFTYYKSNDHPRQSILKPFQRKYLRILMLSSLSLFLTTWIYLTIKYYFRFFFKYERGDFLTEEILGMWLMPIFIGSIIGYYSAGYLADKIGRKKSIYITVAIYFIGSLIFLSTWDTTLLFISFFIINFSFAIFRLVVEILAVEYFQTEVRAVGSGWVFTFASIAVIVGNFIMFYLVDALGGWGITFLIIGTICLIALVLITHFLPETKHRIVEEIYLTEIERVESC